MHNEIELIRLINEYEQSNQTMPILFHGTDESVIDLSDTERESINKACEIIIFTLFKILKTKSIGFTDPRLLKSKDSHGDSSYAYVCAESRFNSSSLYSYGDFYSTNNLPRAIRFSDQAWIYGETGWVANRLVEASEEIGLTFPDDEQFIQAYNLFNQRKQRRKSPVVLMLLNCPIRYCQTEKGAPINDELGKAILDKRIAMNFRVSSKCLYDFPAIYLIKNKYYNDLITTWNEYVKR